VWELLAGTKLLYSSVQLKARDYLRDLGLDGKITLLSIFNETGQEIMQWINVSQDRGERQVVLNTVMNILVL
jgi:hypothetical protein